MTLPFFNERFYQLRGPSLSRSMSRTSVFSTRFQDARAKSPKGCWEMSLQQLCTLVNESPSLAQSSIVRMYCHQSGIFMHKFMVVMLEREGRHNVRLRLDRRTTGFRDLFTGLGSTKANDTVSGGSKPLVCTKFTSRTLRLSWLRLNNPLSASPHTGHRTSRHFQHTSGKR